MGGEHFHLRIIVIINIKQADVQCVFINSMLVHHASVYPAMNLSMMLCVF